MQTPERGTIDHETRVAIALIEAGPGAKRSDYVNMTVIFGPPDVYGLRTVVDFLFR